MSTIRVDIPESLQAAANEWARESGTTVGQLMASALAEKLSVLAGRGERAWFFVDRIERCHGELLSFRRFSSRFLACAPASGRAHR